MPMDPLRLRTLWLILGWLGVAAIIYLSLTPKPPVPDLGMLSWDKLNHFMAYAVLMGWFGQLYHRPLTRSAFAALFIGMGIALEFLQGLGRERLFEYNDMLANTLGIVFAYVVTLGTLGTLLQRLERQLFKTTR